MQTNSSAIKALSERIFPIQIRKYNGWVTRRYNDDGFQLALDAFLKNDMLPGNAIKTSKHSEVYRLIHGESTFFIKRYLIRGIKAYLQTLCRHNKAQKSWRIGRIMLARGLSTPLPVFYIQRKISRTRSEHILGTLGIPQSVSLKDYVQYQFGTSEKSIRQKRRFIEQLAQYIARLHLNGIYHGDLTARNILVGNKDTAHQIGIYLIDLDAIRSIRWISTRRRIKNLDELGRNFLDLRIVDGLDRARFVKHYLAIYTRDKRKFRPFMHAVMKRTTFRLKRHRQQFYRTDLLKEESKDDHS